MSDSSPLENEPTPENSVQPSTEGDPPSLARRKIIWKATALVLGILMVIALIVKPQLPDAHVRYSREQQGEWSKTPENGRWDLRGEAHLGTIKARNNMSSVAVGTGPDQGRLNCGWIVVTNLSDHLLMQRVGNCLVEHLKKLKDIETIDYFSHGGGPKPGEQSPDAWVTLELAELKKTGLGLGLEAHIRVTMANTLIGGNVNYGNDLDPPEARFRYDGVLEHHSTTFAVGTRSSRYKLAGENIAQQIGESLVKKFNDLYKDKGPMPELPEEFYPAYRKTPSIWLPKDDQAELVASCHGLMQPNETLWRIETTRPVSDVLTDLKNHWKEDGWKIQSFCVKEKQIKTLRAAKGEGSLTAYQQERVNLRPFQFVITDGNGLAVKEPPESRVVFVHYVDRMSDKALHAALDRLIKPGVPLDKAMIFEDYYQGKQRQRFIEQLEQASVKTVDQWIVLAEFYRKANNQEKARDALVRANLLLRAEYQPGNREDKIDKLAKTLGMKIPKALEPTKELLDECGFIELHYNRPIADREVTLDEPVLFYLYSDSGKLKTIAVRVDETTLDNIGRCYSFVHVKKEEGSSSSGSTSLDSKYISLGHGRSMKFRMKQIDEQPRFRIEAEWSKE